MGELTILNVGAGDTKIIFDKNNPTDMIRGARIVKDMLARGYALLIETTDKKGEKAFTRVHDFIEHTAEYIIADLDPTVVAPAQETEDEPVKPGRGNRSVQPGRGRRKVAASDSTVVAVARSAGG